jgi:hypothetical protein
MLDQISSPHIDHIALRFINNSGDLDKVPWNQMARLFANKFKELKSLRIRCVGKSEEMDKLAKMFPRLYHKGIIQFRCDSDSDNGAE